MISLTDLTMRKIYQKEKLLVDTERAKKGSVGWKTRAGCVLPKLIARPTGIE